MSLLGVWSNWRWHVLSYNTSHHPGQPETELRSACWGCPGPFWKWSHCRMERLYSRRVVWGETGALFVDMPRTEERLTRPAFCILHGIRACGKAAHPLTARLAGVHPACAGSCPFAFRHHELDPVLWFNKYFQSAYYIRPGIQSWIIEEEFRSWGIKTPQKDFNVDKQGLRGSGGIITTSCTAVKVGLTWNMLSHYLHIPSKCPWNDNILGSRVCSYTWWDMEVSALAPLSGMLSWSPCPVSRSAGTWPVLDSIAVLTTMEWPAYLPPPLNVDTRNIRTVLTHPPLPSVLHQQMFDRHLLNNPTSWSILNCSF